MGKLMWTMVIILLFGCSPDSAQEQQEENSSSTQNSPLNEEVDEAEKLRKELEATQKAMQQD